jgi:hypothetical protein
MRGFALTSVVVAGSVYERDIIPLTWPLMEAYAGRHEMAWEPLTVTEAELAEFNDSPAPHGTAADYVSVQHRIKLCDRFNGQVFLDADAVIVDPTFDICREVNWNVPICAVWFPHEVIYNFGVVVGRGPLFRAWLEAIWAQRHRYGKTQWLEQQAGNVLGGLSNMSSRWNWGPRSEPLPKQTDPAYEQPLIFHPAGVQPYADRLALVQYWERQANT